MIKRILVSSVEMENGKHKVILETDCGTRHLIHLCNGYTVQHLEYDEKTETEESFRDYKLIVQTIKSVLEQYGQK